MIDSPKLLLPTGKFDSTPRERSQSVQYSENCHILSSKVAANRNKLPYGDYKADSKRENKEWGEIDEGRYIIDRSAKVVSLMIQPPTPPSSVMPMDPNEAPNVKDNVLLKKVHSSNEGEFTQSSNKSQKMNTISPFDDTSASPNTWTGVKLGSPPPLKKDVPSIIFPTDVTAQTSKPKHLDLSSGIGPSITITPMSDLESDTDSFSNCKDSRSMSCFAGNASTVGTGNTDNGDKSTGSTAGMHYLSPFTLAVPIPTTCSNSNSRTTSDSNLSSSGYSSMASPGPSRSGSFNPICASESEDASSWTPTKTSCSAGGASFFHHSYQHPGHYRTSPRPSVYQPCAIHVTETGEKNAVMNINRYTCINLFLLIITLIHQKNNSHNQLINIFFAGSNGDNNGANTSNTPVTSTQQSGFGPPIFMRRPSPLLKSPSFDSETSDPLNPSFPITCYSNDNCNSSRTVSVTTQRHSVPSIHNSISDRSVKQFFPASAFRYRTDSDTTDDQCIPESLSEEPGHDSALDTTEDIDEEDVAEEEELNDVSPNIDGPKVPQLCLSEAGQSSTESEKTVILDYQPSAAIQEMNGSIDNTSALSLMTENQIATDNYKLDDQAIKYSMLSLPDIVVLPGTPSASSPSAPSSPTSHTTSSSSSVSIITAAGLASLSSTSKFQASVQMSVDVTESPVLESSSNMVDFKSNTRSAIPAVSKANSTPAYVLSVVPASSFDYEQLVANNSSNNTATTSTAPSGCSSRSESPMSDRGVIKCSSLISLHLRNIESDSGNVLGFPICTLNCASETALDVAKQVSRTNI